MKFETRHAANGVILRVEDENPDALPEEVVYQEQEQEHADIEAFADFLRHILDHYGPTTRRYSPKRIHVVVEPGDKCEG